MESYSKTQRGLLWPLFLLYIGFVLWVILFKMSFSMDAMGSIRTLNLIPFRESAITNGTVNVFEIVANALIFIPCGIYLSALCPEVPAWGRLAMVCAFSIALEAGQYALAIGRSDITDVIQNTMGGAIGLGAYAIIRRVFRGRTAAVVTGCAGFFSLCMALFLWAVQ
ncbi:VanZ family protein [Eubacteriales bacterium OttesenSCG-928-M02]|nr:VanZ family protein [Eubacteriales bacterium OttesenSCG-928-M02]